MKKVINLDKGINLGGWLSQCEHNTEHYDTFISKDDIKRIASWGLDHVRVPFDYELLESEDGNTIDTNFKYLDNCIEWCKEYNIVAIFDLHKAFGYSFINAYKSSNNLFNDEQLQQRYINFWQKIARRYGGYSECIVFELLNEIVELEYSEPWNKLSRRVIKAIREYAPETKIIMGGVCWNSISTVNLLEKPYDKNIIYTFHCYEPLVFTHQNAYWVEEIKNIGLVNYPITLENMKAECDKLSDIQKYTLKKININDEKNIFFSIFKNAVDFAEKNNVMLYCGEYGVIDKAPVDDTLLWYKDINEAFIHYNIGRCAWSYKEMDFGIIDDHYKPIMKQLIKYL